MSRKRWLVIAPIFLLAGAGGGALLGFHLGRDPLGRIASRDFFTMEKSLGIHLYAPTGLPRGGQVGPLGIRKGRYRILQDFTDSEGQAMVFLAQETRTTDRDVYHKSLFVNKAEARATVQGKNAYFITGASGERRLFWNEEDSALILSSSVLTDEELLGVAQTVR